MSKADPVAAPKLRLLSDTLTRRFATVSGNSGWPVVTGQVRPAMSREVGAFTRLRDEAKTPEAQERVRCEFYARHIRAWDVVAEDGSPVPVTPATVAAMPYPVWLQFEDIVLGFRGPDPAE